jgi:hypothetical protein
MVIALAALAGCSSAPDWANPVAWYDSVFGQPAPAGPAFDKPVPGADEAYPLLGSVPQRPRPPTGSAERQRLVDSLLADRETVAARRQRLYPGQQ